MTGSCGFIRNLFVFSPFPWFLNPLEITTSLRLWFLLCCVTNDKWTVWYDRKDWPPWVLDWVGTCTSISLTSPPPTPTTNTSRACPSISFRCSWPICWRGHSKRRQPYSVGWKTPGSLVWQKFVRYFILPMLYSQNFRNNIHAFWRQLICKIAPRFNVPFKFEYMNK